MKYGECLENNLYNMNDQILEKKLYDLVELIKNINRVHGIEVYKSELVDTRFTEEENGYRVHHKNGMCFDITREMMYDEEDRKKGWFYEYHKYSSSGFVHKDLGEALKDVKEVLKNRKKHKQ